MIPTIVITGIQSPLCKDCRKALDLWGSNLDKSHAGDGRPSRGPPEAVLHQTEIPLRDRVATGCRLCIQIYNSFEGETRSFDEATFRPRFGTDEAAAKAGLETWGYMRTWRQGGPPNDDYEKTDLSIRRWRPMVDMKFSVRLHRVRDRGCTDCSRPGDIERDNEPPWGMMRKWLKDCIDTHDGPCKPSGPKFVPSRLLNLGIFAEPLLKLELRDELSSGVEYVTLSHCWGPVVPKRLLLENFHDFRKAISTEGLSLTFRDAIETTRKLGHQFIWIDSLCIIQNSTEDWQAEAKSMGQVYAGGVCNLAAVAAIRGSQGLFLYKPPMPEVEIEFDGKRDLWHLDENPGFHWGSILNFAPLNWRGWVIQERFLSTRVIYFGRSRVYWECGQRKCCEHPGHGHTHPTNFSSNSWTNQSKGKWQAFINGNDEVDKDKAVEIWNTIVDHYSSHCDFTYVTDKLLAIGGLASKIQKSTKSRYFAGVWKHDIRSQLMWDVGKHGAQEVSSGPYVAPSWSWASIDVPISRYRIGRGGSTYKPTAAVDFLKFDIDLVAENDFGQVKSGSLTLAGRPAFIEDMRIFQPGTDGELRSPESIELRFDRKEEVEEGGHTPLFLLLIEEERKEESYQGAGLAIRPWKADSGAPKKNVFRRIGFFQFWFNDKMKNEVGELQQKFEKTIFAEDLPTVEKKDGKLQYIVELI